jgi:four helix bundle protein
MTDDGRQMTESKQKSKKVIKNVKDLFIRHLNDSLGSSEETRGWLDFAKDCLYITKSEYNRLDDRYDQVNAMLYSLMNNWQTFSDI